MSLKSWKEEFYPLKEGEDNTDYFKLKSVTGFDALQHSLQKWIGFLPENLARHQVELRDAGQLFDPHFGPPPPTDTDEDPHWEQRSDRMASQASCACCSRWHPGIENTCDMCPLFLVREVRCFEFSEEEDRKDPYSTLMEDKDPLPMIRLLYKALTYYFVRYHR